MLALALAGAPAWAKDEKPKAPPPASLAELEQRLRELLAASKTPGAGVALADREHVLWATGLGLADVAQKQPATADTLFRIGSVSKMFVGLAVMQEVEQGKLALDAPVASLVPDVRFSNPWEATDPVRLVHLLEHTTGFDDLAFTEYAHNDPRPVTLAEGLAYYPHSRTSRWRPGSRFAYCNSGPAVAAAVLEKVTGQRFEDLIGERFFTPLGMPHASYFLTPEVAARLTSLYHPDGVTPYSYWHVILRPAGSINASPAELIQLVRLFLNRGAVDGRALLAPESIARIETPATQPAARLGMHAGYGLHNYTSIEDGFVWHGHDGGVEGGVTRLGYLPEAGVGYVLMINSGDGELLGKLAEAIRGYLTHDLAKPAPPATTAVPPEIAERFDGWYVAASPRVEKTRFLDRLIGLGRAQVAADGLALHPVLGDDVFYPAVSARTFRDKEGPIARIALVDGPEGRWIQTDHQTVERVSTARAWLQIVLGAATLALLVLSPLVLAVLVVLKLLGKLRDGGRISSWLWQPVPTLCLLAVVGIFALSGDDLLTRMGKPSVWSLGVTALTLACAVATIFALRAAFRRPAEGSGRWLRGWERATAAASLVAVLYLAYFGMIGFLPWR